MTKNKLTAKQDVQGATDLSAFIAGAETPKRSSTPSKPSDKKLKKVLSKRGGGRPAEIQGEPRSAVVNVKFTPSEKQTLEKKARGVPLSSYVRTLLKEQKVI